MAETELLQEIIGRNHSEDTAIVHRGMSITYGEMNRAIHSLASHLVADLLMKKGDRVTILLQSDWRFVISLYAVIKGGGIAVPVDFRSSVREYQYIVENTSAVIQILDSGKESFASELCRETVVLNESTGSQPSELLDHFPESNSEETAVIFYTGGTTGFPKGVPLSHRNIIHVLRSLADAWKLENGKERFVQFLPMTHSGGFNCSMNTCLYTGGTAVIMDRFSPEELLDNIEKYRATVIVGVPTVYSSLVKNTDLKRRDTSSIKVFFSSGAKLPENIEEAFFRGTGKHITVGWGLTEASPQLTVSPTGTFRENYVGKPLPETSVVAVDESGNVLPNGEIGVLAARGNQVMKGYWRNSEKNLTVYTKDGYLLTGDLGYVGKDGIYLMGRTKDVIISGGYKIWRNEVENALLEHECVGETAVIGVDDPLYGETVKAFIVPKCETSSDEITNFCRSRISAYKVPRIIEFRPELPKSSLGKILHKVLESENPQTGSN